jgi:hypothetical protein
VFKGILTAKTQRPQRKKRNPCLLLLSVLSFLAVKILGFGFAGF